LRVNLTEGTCSSEPLNMEWAKEYLGQRGLATRYFVDEVDPKVDPLSPENKIIWATGPLTGTMASTGGRYSVITKSALTGGIGCKNLKASAVRGTKGVGNIRDARAFMKAAADAKQVLKDNAVTGQGLPTFGTQVLMNVINEIGAMPTRNHRDVQFEGAKDISGEAMHEPRKTDGKANLVTNQACFGCTIARGRISKIDENHYKVKTRTQ